MATSTPTATHEEHKKGETAEAIREIVTVLSGDFSQLAGPRADKALSHWQTTLEGLGGPSLKTIAVDLGKLKALVTEKDPDGAKISKSLTGLGDKVKQVAEDQGGVLGTALSSLATALHKGGTSLAGQ